MALERAHQQVAVVGRVAQQLVGHGAAPPHRFVPLAAARLGVPPVHRRRCDSCGKTRTCCNSAASHPLTRDPVSRIAAHGRRRCRHHRNRIDRRRARPTAEALAVADGRIIAVGDRSEIDAFIGTDTQTIDIGDGCVMPGFIEAHGHPLMEAIALSDRLVDIRPVTLRSADDVVAAVHREVAHRGPDGAYLNGWDPLLQSGLPQPTLAWLR